MANYSKLYERYEENSELHAATADTAAIETQVAEYLHTLPAETAFTLDTLLGQLVRAYEKQGFLFGMNCANKGCLKVARK